MKKLSLIIILAVAVAAGICGCKKDDGVRETLIYVFEDKEEKAAEEFSYWIPVDTGNGYMIEIEADSVSISSAYFSFELNDFAYDGEMRMGLRIYILRGECFTTYMNEVRTHKFDANFNHEIEYKINDTVFSFKINDPDYSGWIINSKIINHTDSSFAIDYGDRTAWYKLSHIKKPD